MVDLMMGKNKMLAEEIHSKECQLQLVARGEDEGD